MRKGLSIILVLMLVAVFVGGCGESGTSSSSSQSSKYGNVQVRVHDAPPEYQITEIWVTIDEVQVHRANAERQQEPIVDEGTPMQEPEEPVDEGTPSQEPVNEGTPTEEPDDTDAVVEEGGSDAGWISLAISGSNPFNLLEYQNGLEGILAAQEMEAGKYTQIRMSISNVEVVTANEGGTETFTAKLPSGKLKFVRGFDVVAGETTVLSFDFIAEKSIVFSGGGKVTFKPVIKLDVTREKGDGSTPTGEPNGEPTGEPTPADEPTPDEEPAPSDEPAAGDNPAGAPKGKGKAEEPTPDEGDES